MIRINWHVRPDLYIRLHRGAILGTHVCISVLEIDSEVQVSGTTHPSALGDERVRVIDCGPSLGDYVIPDTGICMHQVPTRYIFVTVVYIARNMYTLVVRRTMPERGR